MKLLHVVAGMDPKGGGVCQAVRTIITGLKVLNVHNEVVCLDAENAPYLSQDSFRIHAIGPGKGPWGYNSKLIPWCIENLPRFDTVVLHGLWLFPDFAIWEALRQLTKINSQKDRIPKFFVMPHGMLDPYFQQAPERKLKALRNWLYWKLIESKIVNQAEGLLFTCEEERLLAKESFSPYIPKQEIVVGLGVEEPPTFTPSMQEAFLEKCPTLDHRPYLLFLSRIHEKKGVDLLLNAYNEIWAEWLKTKAESSVKPISTKEVNSFNENHFKELPALIIAGPGLDTHYGKKIQALASESLAPKGTILFPGMLSGDAKWGAFYGCEVFVLPSHQENFGIAIVEALACGKSVLITNQVNIWREIKTSNSGLVADDTQMGIQKMLKNWISLSKNEKQNFRQRACDAYQQHFANNFIIKKWTTALK